MRLRNVKNKEEILKNNEVLINDPKSYYGKWHILFNNDHPIEVEVGMGKGQFIINKAKLNPDINYIGIERFDSVMARAIEKVEEKLPNLYFIKIDASEIDTLFDHEITTLYLNFSDPWPKKRHQLRRLTSPIFLDKYRQLFKKEQLIQFRTDNRHLFEYSIETLSNNGYQLFDIHLDLHQEELASDFITTEYEDKFVNLNHPIYELKARQTNV